MKRSRVCNRDLNVGELTIWHGDEFQTLSYTTCKVIFSGIHTASLLTVAYSYRLYRLCSAQWPPAFRAPNRLGRNFLHL